MAALYHVLLLIYYIFLNSIWFHTLCCGCNYVGECKKKKEKEKEKKKGWIAEVPTSLKHWMLCCQPQFHEASSCVGLLDFASCSPIFFSLFFFFCRVFLTG